MLDPCMGSGHFLVFALPILVAFRMAEEGLSQSAAVEAVLRDNLFGLEIDPRCTQIAAFNLAFAAWRRLAIGRCRSSTSRVRVSRSASPRRNGSNWRKSGVEKKREAIASQPTISLNQKVLAKNPDSRILVDTILHSEELLSTYAACYQGLRTGDKERFVLQFWELAAVSDGWEPLRTCGPADKPGSGNSHVILWQGANGQLHRYAAETRDRLHDMHESGNRAWGQTGVAIAQVRTLNASLYGGERFDNSLAVIYAKDNAHTPAVQAYCLSNDFTQEVRKLDLSLNVTNATLSKSLSI